ncbi:MAG: type II toxin-antitoxin system RelE/ParE family toxin [Candidatus Sericytochromatia bacterium]|nr:type II toxin-antitoxin system RelE/ParE family toxin [Candidatus Sericytochromatia bacterium]
MIKAFRDRTTAAVAKGDCPKGFPANLVRVAVRKFGQLDSAEELASLMVPPGNRLEALRGDRVGQHSVRINDQWRICFEWRDGDAWNVEIVDYH